MTKEQYYNNARCYWTANTAIINMQSGNDRIVKKIMKLLELYQAKMYKKYKKQFPYDKIENNPYGNHGWSLFQ